MNIIELGKASNIKGKAGTLNSLYNEFNIARGFIIPNNLFKEFLKTNSISLKANLTSIKNKIINGKFPNENEILTYFREKKYKKVIVRSSASLEDGNNFSFAGQFDSFLNTDMTSLILNIKKCWLSQYKENVKSYLKESKIKKTLSFDVLIQEMIISNISGIAFSINPTNGNQEILIELTDDSCEKLASGKIEPHTYHINKKIIEDEFVSCDKLLTICDNVTKLKRIFKKDIEIEFGFRENQFYLFQVRPITKVYDSLDDYIKKAFWCCFKNNNWYLFHRSLWILGATKYKNKRINNDVTEDITLYYPNNQKQIRGFNGNEPPLDMDTIKSHKKEDINKYINESYNISENIKNISWIIESNIKNNNFYDFNINLKKLIKQNAILNSYEYLIGSLGNALYNELDEETINNIEVWRNEENNSYFPIYNKIFEYIHSYFNLNINIELLKNYIHVNELIRLCDRRIKTTTILNRIFIRKKNGFVLLNIRNKKYCNKVITNNKIIQVVKDRFKELQQQNTEKYIIDGVKGQSTFKNGKIIKGECVVIKDNGTSISDYDLKGKILVCEVTTAKDIKYIKNVKAMIVNSGGVLCHSAIFSREFNIPCLMGCKIATDYFKTGDIISYNINEEIVKKV